MLSDSRTSNLPADISNPFMAKAPASPAKSQGRRPTDDGLTALREGMGRMDISSRGGPADLGSSTASSREGKEGSGRERDRFVPSRPVSLHHASHSSSTLPTLSLGDLSKTTSPESSFSHDTSSTTISSALGLPTSNRRILSFLAAPPAPTHATSHLDEQRKYLLHATGASSRGTATGGAGAGKDVNGKKRSPPYIPERVLDAPGFADDYYLNLIDWSCANRVAIGLGDVTYVWDAETGSVDTMGEDTGEGSVCSVSWSADGAYLAVGCDSGAVQIYDVEERKKVRTMTGHGARIASMSWNGHILSSGCRDGSIWHHDVRVSQHKVMELMGHSAEVCGLTWRSDGALLASGGNDNVVNCWDGRMNASLTQNTEGTPRGIAKWTKHNHIAAVKALSWCPWQFNLLATGGGSNDQHIHFWSSTTGARTSSLRTDSQVTSLVWSPHSKELLSTHGYPNNNVSVYSYPALTKVYDLPAHDARILGSAISPDGCCVATVAPDENLKFWRIWEVKGGKKDDSERGGEGRGKAAVMIR